MTLAVKSNPDLLTEAKVLLGELQMFFTDLLAECFVVKQTTAEKEAEAKANKEAERVAKEEMKLEADNLQVEQKGLEKSFRFMPKGNPGVINQS